MYPLKWAGSQWINILAVSACFAFQRLFSTLRHFMFAENYAATASGFRGRRAIF